MDNKLIRLNLQLLAEGGDGGTAGGSTASGVVTGDGSNGDLSAVQYGKNSQPVQVADGQEDKGAMFDALVKGEYKEQYDARVKETIDKRFKNAKQYEDKYNALSPALELLAQKYGVDSSDVQALTSAIQEDDSYWEDEALDRGLTVEQLKSIKKMERENAELTRQLEERNTQENADRILNEWLKQAEQTKAMYAGFDFDAELQNPKFVQLLKSGIDVNTAFTVLHKNELIPAAMQYTANTVAQKMSNSVQANASRPRENGMSSSSTATVKSDVSQLSKADRQEIAKRVARGERITF